MNKQNLTNIRLKLTRAATSCARLKEFLREIAETSRQVQAEQVWQQLNTEIREARDKMNAWRIGYPKGKHRISEDQLVVIRQWKSAQHPKPKIRTLAKTMDLSPTTVYSVLKELGWTRTAQQS